MVKNIAGTARQCNRTYENALSMPVSACSGKLPEADIEACVRPVYGL